MSPQEQDRQKSLFPAPLTRSQAKLSFGWGLTHMLTCSISHSFPPKTLSTHSSTHPFSAAGALFTLVYRFLPHHAPVPPSSFTLSLTGVNIEYQLKPFCLFIPSEILVFNKMGNNKICLLCFFSNLGERKKKTFDWWNIKWSTEMLQANI